MAEDEEPGFSAQLICDDLECAKARAGRGGACHFALGGQFSTKTGRTLATVARPQPTRSAISLQLVPFRNSFSIRLFRRRSWGLPLYLPTAFLM
jgi:hypothetical protein